MNITLKQIDNIVIGGIDTRDYPDFCDAYLESCDIDGREATDEECNWIQDNYPTEFYEWVADKAFNLC